jgi:hypothetical protein
VHDAAHVLAVVRRPVAVAVGRDRLPHPIRGGRIVARSRNAAAKPDGESQRQRTGQHRQAKP